MQVFIAESLIWSKASGFYYTIDAGPSLGLLLVILQLPCVMEILQLWVCRAGLPVLQQSTDGVDVGVG